MAKFQEYREKELPNSERQSCAEVLAAMDCLMHHLKVEDHLKQWTEDFPDEQDWNLLDWTPDDAACRTEQYMLAVSGMSDYKFENLVMMFATIVSGACFSRMYQEGAFSFESGLRKNA